MTSTPLSWTRLASFPLARSSLAERTRLNTPLAHSNLDELTRLDDYAVLLLLALPLLRVGVVTARERRPPAPAALAPSLSPALHGSTAGLTASQTEAN